MRNAGAWLVPFVAPRGGASRTWAFVAAVSLLLTVLAYLAAPAQAARIHPLLLSEKLATEETPFGVAVDQATHHFYVASFAENGGPRRVVNFEENGQVDPVSPELTGAPTLRPFQVAVDNSGGPQDGYIYASDTSGIVQQFDASGAATAVTITESAIPPNGTPQGGGLPPVVNNGGFQPRAVAVDKSGNVYAADSTSRAIDVFTPAGEFVRQLAAGSVDENTAGIAVDGAGNIYLANEARSQSSPLGNEGKGLFELNSSGQCVTVSCAPIDPASMKGVAIDETRGTIYTIGSSGAEKGRISEYDATTHALLGVTTGPQLHEPAGIGIQEATGEVVVADLKPANEGTIQIYGPAEVVPDVKTLSPEGIGDEAATLKGEIGAAGVAGATCVFQYVDDQDFEASGFEAAAEAPCQPEGPFSGTTMNPVESRVEGLQGGTTYHERIVGENEPSPGVKGSNPGEDIPFITDGPTISGTAASGIEETAVTLEGSVNPRGSFTTYAFQYVTQAGFEASGFAGATEVPVGGAAIGEGTTPVGVTRRVEGLVPGTSYRMRIVATGTGGTTPGTSDGPDVGFATFAPPNTELPDGRRYEQASPIDKNGANVQGAINTVQASLEGDRVTFFTNTGIPGGEGSQSFPIYLSTRAPDGSGWSTQGLLPPASYGPRASVLGWTENLADTYDFATQAFEAGKLLRRSNVGGALTQVGATNQTELAFAGSSTGGMVALLESAVGGMLPGDLPGKQNLYAYGRETGSLVVAGVLNPAAPGGQPVVPAGGAMAGSYAWFGVNRRLERGGALASYFTQAQHAISADGTEVFFTAGETGQLYVRENPLAPQSAMSGERCTEAAKACTIRISAPAEGIADPGTPVAFVGASADGHLVYFLDQGKLTADATGGSGYDLYRYDLQSGELTDVTRDTADKAGARVEGVLGISASGDRAYFAAAGKLSAEAGQAPLGETNLYVLDGGEVHLIGRLGTSSGANEAESFNWTPTSVPRGERVAHASRVSADGNTLLFRATRQLTAYRNHGVAELYLYRSGAGISCISCNPSGQAPAGPAGLQEIPVVGITIGANYPFMTRNLSADGRRVIFDSADQLVAADKNDVNDVYEWEVPGKGSCSEASSAYSPRDGGCLFLISGGAKEAGASYFGDADEEGENVFFFTAQPLVAQDKDELVDVYDARVGGGIPAQEATPPPPCHEEADCLPHGEGEPTTSTPQSPAAAGANVVPPPRCKRGLVRRHGKCVRRQNKKHHKHKSHHHGKGKRHHQSAKKGGGR